MATKLDLTHRGHRIIAGLLKGQPTARVYLGTALATREPFGGATVAAAADAARTWVDTQRAEATGRRRSPGIGTVEEYIAFFAANPPAQHHRAMLVAHAAAPGRTMSACQLAEAAGWSDFGGANLHYGLLGDQVAHALELELPKHADGTPILTAALATSAGPDWKPVNGVFLWQMHEEVAEALSHLNIR